MMTATRARSLSSTSGPLIAPDAVIRPLSPKVNSPLPRNSSVGRAVTKLTAPLKLLRPYMAAWGPLTTSMRSRSS